MSSAVAVGPGEQRANPCRIRGADEAATRDQHHLTGLSLSPVTGLSLEPSWPPWPPCDPALLVAIPPSLTAAVFVIFLPDPPSSPSVTWWRLTEKAERFRGHFLPLRRRVPPPCPPESSCHKSPWVEILRVVNTSQHRRRGEARANAEMEFLGAGVRESVGGTHKG